MDGVVEIITGRERRRRWSTADKLRIVAETHEPGVRVCDVAARYGLCESLVFAWRRQVRAGVLAPEPMPVFVPVQIADDAPLPGRPAFPSPCPAPAKGAPAETERIGIALPDGTCIRVGADVGVAALRRVLAALRG